MFHVEIGKYRDTKSILVKRQRAMESDRRNVGWKRTSDPVSSKNFSPNTTFHCAPQIVNEFELLHTITLTLPYVGH